MAIATATKKTITVILELSEEEAAVLLTLTGVVTGDPKSSPRKFVSSVWDALHELADKNPEIRKKQEIYSNLCNDNIWFDYLHGSSK